MTTSDDINDINDIPPIIQLAQRHRDMIFKSIEATLAAIAVAYLLTDGLVHIGIMRYVAAVDILGIVYAKIVYRIAKRRYAEQGGDNMKSYCDAKLQYCNTTTILIFVSAMAHVLCPEPWISILMVIMCGMQFFEMPSIAEMKKDFYSPEDE
jgi:hypothetical protein